MTNTTVGYTPLTELGAGDYLGAQGGLYAGGTNDMPPAHLAAGDALAATIQPLDATGNPSPGGKIGVITTGMSNANQIFERLGELLQGAWADKVVYVNAAQGGMDASIWADKNSTAWSVVMGKLTEAGLSTKQVQVALNYHAIAHINTPPQPWPATPGDLQAFMETIAGHLRSTFPQLRLSFWGTREYGGYATSANSPEPYAYQSGIGVKWMIERQINGVALNYDPARGAVTAPWMAWGPYTWADGIKPRTDGLFYEPRDFRRDGTHPSMRGRAKGAWPWVQFLRTHPLTAARLFPPGNRPPVSSISFPQDSEEIMVGGKVAVEAFAGDEDSGIQRVDFYQGTSLIGSDDSAPYSILWSHPGPGDYPVHVVARDMNGNERSSLAITAKLRTIATYNNTIAEDSFESGDFRGGSGWNGEWTVSGNPVILSGQAEDGLYSARMDDGDALARSLNLSAPTSSKLRFAWRGNLPAGTSLLVEIRDTAWRTVFNPAATSQSTWSVVELPLAAYQAASSFGLRFRILGTGALIHLDRIQFTQTAQSSGPAAVSLDISPARTNGILLDWVSGTSRTDTVQSSTDLGGWNDLYHVTGDESSVILLPQTLQHDSRFFRVAAGIP